MCSIWSLISLWMLMQFRLSKSYFQERNISQKWPWRIMLSVMWCQVQSSGNTSTFWRMYCITEDLGIMFAWNIGKPVQNMALQPKRLYTGCPGGNVPDIGRMFLTLKYTDITQNTYVYPKLNGYGDNGERSSKVWQLLHTYWLPNTY